MENKNQPESNPQKITSANSSTSLSIREATIVAKIVEVNLLVSFKMEGQEIVDWALELNRLMSIEDLKKLPFILDSWKKNELIYDQKIGIQNFFIAAKQVKMEDGQFKILRTIW